MTSPLPQQPRKKTTGAARKVEVVGSGVAGGVGSVFGAAKLRDEFLKDPKVKPEHKAAFKRATVHGGRAAMRAGVKPEKVAHVVRAVESGHPGFKPLAVAVTAGTLATTAHRGQELQRAIERRAKSREWSGGKSAPRHTGPKVRVAVVYHAPKHAVKPYSGKRRVPTVVDRLKANVKTTAMIHGPRVYRVLEEGVEMLKAACCTGDMTGVPRSAFLKGIGKVRVVGYHGGGKFHVIDSSDAGRVVHRDNLNFHRTKKGTDVAKSAFGVDHPDAILKADSAGYKPNKAPSTGRQVTGTVFGAAHSAVAGKKGRKLGAVGSSIGHAYGGSLAGSLAGAALTRGKSPGAIGAGSLVGAYGGSHRAVVTNSRKGRYKPESK